MAIPLRSESESYLSILLSRTELEGFHDYDELINSGKKIDFQINKDHYQIQNSLVKTNTFAMYSGLVNNHDVFIKVFAKENDYLTELKVLRTTRSEELLDSYNQKFPLLVLKHRDGKMLSQIVRDFVLNTHFEENPQDMDLIDKLWPNYEEVSAKEFKEKCDAFTDSDYSFTMGDEDMVHRDLDPNKVLITPKLEAKVYDYTKYETIPNNKIQRRLLAIKIEEELVDSLKGHIQVMKAQIIVDIKKARIPVEVYLNHDIGSTSLMDSYDDAFPPLKNEKPNDLTSQDLHFNGFEKHHGRKKPRANPGSSVPDKQLPSNDLWWSAPSDEDNLSSSRSSSFRMDDAAENVQENDAEKPNWLFNFFSGKQSAKNDFRIDEEESDEENGVTILDADYFPDLPDQNFNRQFYDSEPSSAHTESFYSAMSDYHSVATQGQSTPKLRKHRSAESLISKALHAHQALDGLAKQGGISRAKDFFTSVPSPPDMRLTIH